RWQEMFVGVDPDLARSHGVADVASAAELLPNLHRLIASRGVALGAPGHGEPMNATGPNFVSLPGYTEIFSGRTPSTCADNGCAATRSPTIVDELRTNAGCARDVAV